MGGKYFWPKGVPGCVFSTVNHSGNYSKTTTSVTDLIWFDLKIQDGCFEVKGHRGQIRGQIATNDHTNPILALQIDSIHLIGTKFSMDILIDPTINP